MIDKDIKYKDVPQLVKPRKDGKRPGYRGDDAARSSEGTSGGRADPGGAGRGDTRGDPGPADDRGTAQQNANQRAQVRAGNVRAVEDLIDRPLVGFTDAATYNLLSPKSIGSGIISLATGVPFLGSILTNMGPFNNQDFYDQKVAPAGITDLSYDDYMDARLSGEIDAYGNPIGNIGGNGGSAPSQAQLIQQAAIVNPLANITEPTPAPQENLQGGVAQLYAQYMRNLGYNV